MTGSRTSLTDAAVAAVFGAGAPRAQAYAELLAGPGIERGLLGPRERDRIWDRHLFNCAAVADLVPPGERVVDIGSGAGLPGLALAIRRPDLHVDLVESLERRCAFLAEAVVLLDLQDRVRVVRGRAEEPEVQVAVGHAAVATARAVAPLGRLARWALPLLQPGGRLLALKGEQAAAELAAAGEAVRRAGGHIDGIQQLPTPIGEPARVVVVTRRDRRRGRA